MNEASGSSSTQRQRRFEHAARIWFIVCCGVLLGDLALEAYSSPRDLGQCIIGLPGHLIAAVVIGAASILVPYTRARLHAAVRIGALVALIGSIVWIGFTEGVVILYAVVMSAFD